MDSESHGQKVEKWFYSDGEEKYGPFSESMVKSEIEPGDFVWKTGMDDWQRAEEVFNLVPEPPQLPSDLDPQSETPNSYGSSGRVDRDKKLCSWRDIPNLIFGIQFLAIVLGQWYSLGFRLGPGPIGSVLGEAVGFSFFSLPFVTLYNISSYRSWRWFWKWSSIIVTVLTLVLYLSAVSDGSMIRW